MLCQPPLSQNDRSDGKFLIDPPPQVGSLLKWFDAGAKPGACNADLEAYASAFLGTLVHDHAVIPPMDVYPPKLLAWVLTHHIRSPENCAAWLNLGLAIRVMAKSDEGARREARLQRALECFDRAITAPHSSTPAMIRAWIGKALVFRQQGRYTDAVHSSREALDLEPSDANLWLLQSSFLSMAGRKEEALELIQRAYDAYLMAGEPEELRDVFESATSTRPSELR